MINYWSSDLITAPLATLRRQEMPHGLSWAACFLHPQMGHMHCLSSLPANALSCRSSLISATDVACWCWVPAVIHLKSPLLHRASLSPRCQIADSTVQSHSMACALWFTLLTFPLFSCESQPPSLPVYKSQIPFPWLWKSLSPLDTDQFLFLSPDAAASALSSVLFLKFIHRQCRHLSAEKFQHHYLWGKQKWRWSCCIADLTLSH